MMWPTTFALAKAYTDQLERSGGLSASRVAAVRSGIAGAEAASGSVRRDALTKLAASIDGDAGSSKDAAKVKTLATVVRELSTK